MTAKLATGASLQAIIDDDFSDIGRSPHTPLWIWLAPLLLVDCAIASAIVLVALNVVLI